MRKKSRLIKFTKKFFSLLIGIVIALVKSLTIDLFRNAKLYFKLSTDKEEKEKIKKHLDIAKRQEVIEERLERIERLVYAVYNDPSYGKRNEGEYDLKHLKEEIKK
ncbi:MAG: hypothetical protein U9Q69_04855 [Nanoarchaeota archaeon]|nr:hypothetical protein [Nanoarchaeota archaeon]